MRAAPAAGSSIEGGSAQTGGALLAQNVQNGTSKLATASIGKYAENVRAFPVGMAVGYCVPV
jgi:hypothetical protein